MNYDTDPYFQGKIEDIQTNFLNFNPMMGVSNPGTFFFSGNAFSIKKRVDEISFDEMAHYKSVRINLTGTQIKQGNICCFIWTIIWGSLIIFPLFFLCCSWWKKIVNKLYKVQNEGYDAVINIIKMSQADELYLMVQDHYFSRRKGQALFQALQHSKIQNFVFRNSAGGFDTEGSNYSNFSEYMRPIKSAVYRTDISWSNKVVL